MKNDPEFKKIAAEFKETFKDMDDEEIDKLVTIAMKMKEEKEIFINGKIH